MTETKKKSIRDYHWKATVITWIMLMVILALDYSGTIQVGVIAIGNWFFGIPSAFGNIFVAGLTPPVNFQWSLFLFGFLSTVEDLALVPDWSSGEYTSTHKCVRCLGWGGRVTEKNEHMNENGDWIHNVCDRSHRDPGKAPYCRYCGNTFASNKVTQCFSCGATNPVSPVI